MSQDGHPYYQQQQQHQHFRPPPAPMWFGPNVGQAAPLSSTPRWFGDSVEAFSSSSQHAPFAQLPGLNHDTTSRPTALQQFTQGPRPQLPRSDSASSQYSHGQLHGSLVAGDGAFSPPGQYQLAQMAQLPFPSPHSQNIQHQHQPVSQAHYYQLQQTRALASGDETFGPRAQISRLIPLARPQFPNLTLSPDGTRYQHGQQARSLPGVGTVFSPQVPQPRFASLPPDAAFFSRITTKRGVAGLAQQHAPFSSPQNGVHHSSDPLVDHDTNYQLRAPSQRPRDTRLPIPQLAQPASFAPLARNNWHLSSISQDNTASHRSDHQASSTLGQPLQPPTRRDSLSSRLRQDSGYESLYAPASIAGSKRSRSCLSSSSASLTDDASSEGEWTSVRSLTPLLPSVEVPLGKVGARRESSVALERARLGSVVTSSPGRIPPSRHPRKAPSSGAREAPKRSNVKIVRPPRKTAPGPTPRRPSKRAEGPKGRPLKRASTAPQARVASTTPQPPTASQKQAVICSAADIDLDSVLAITPDIVFIDPKFHHSPISVYKLSDPSLACTVITKWLEFCNNEATAPLTLRLEDQQVKLIDQKKPAHLVVLNDAAHFDGEPRRPVVVLAVLIKGDSKIRWYYSDHPSDEVLVALNNKKCLTSPIDSAIEVKPGRKKHNKLFIFLRQAFEQAIKIPEHPDFVAAMILTDYSPFITDPDDALERVISTIKSHQTLNSNKTTTPHLDRYATYLHRAEEHLCSLVSLSSSAYLLLKRKFFHAFWREVLADYEKIGMGRRKVRTELAHENWLVGYEALTAKDNSKGGAIGERRLKGREARKLIVGWRVMGLLEETRFLEWAKGGGMLEGVGNSDEEKEEENKDHSEDPNEEEKEEQAEDE
ncbi:hypothetical protein LTR56_001124 [Elasticomyces elasticus]|nr:hypothetical protein LTR56_001124 [Elasticomyces elasticus]KAK3663524.1 hypothetical protein LTR22_005696 [Elasticomyces elasticus]KAK4927089.1 hypothetical protein LTR49_006004 [Elasticomyces elasticus]KAK5769045.1 hypothetical protein LTS12_000759 [Elasticomyces elasticus]